MTSHWTIRGGGGGDDDDDEAEVVESIVHGKLDRLPPAVPRSVCVFISSTFSGMHSSSLACLPPLQAPQCSRAVLLFHHVCGEGDIVISGQKIIGDKPPATPDISTFV